jgi:ABC-type amino acid transport substrate-binding protein
MRVRTLLRSAGVAVCLFRVAPAPAQEARPIRFCLAADNLPMSAAYPPPSGVEVELARALAAELNTEAELQWLDHADRGEDAVLAGRCEAAFGAVVDPGLADGRVLPGLALSTPYLGAGYQLVRRSDAPPARSLAELGEARIGVEVESVPIYTLKQRGHRVHALDDSDAVIEAVADGRVRYGYLWGPLATWLLRDRADVVPVREFEPEERWDFALIVREAAVPLRERLDGALRRLVATGAIEEIALRYGVRYLRPETGGAGRADRGRR